MDFFSRLARYFDGIAKALLGVSDAAGGFANRSDIGMTRELNYLEFLRRHVPTKCNVLLGGFVFDEIGNESTQLDILVTTDTCPQYQCNPFFQTKSWACVEGTIACVSVKSTLTKKELEDSLWGFASIPPTRPLGNRIPPNFEIPNYADWPLKIIFASDGLDLLTILSHWKAFYERNDIPIDRRPNLIHVAGKYLIRRSLGYDHLNQELQPAGTVYGIQHETGSASPDVQAIIHTINDIQTRATESAQILFNYNFLTSKVPITSGLKVFRLEDLPSTHPTGTALPPTGGGKAAS